MNAPGSRVFLAVEGAGRKCKNALNRIMTIER